MKKLCSASEAVQCVTSNSTIASPGVIGWTVPDALLRALGERFETEQTPQGLTFFFPTGGGDAFEVRGMDHVAKAGLMKRIVSGNYVNTRDPATGERPKLMQLIQSNAIEAYSWPIGAGVHWLREVTRGSPGYLTKVGLGCYIDPRNRGGKFTDKCQDDLVRLVNFEGKDYLFYPSWKLDFGFIRASSADENGNLSFEDEPLISTHIATALAVKACGGTVIAQVKRIVKKHSRLACDSRIPASLVDKVVVAEDAPMTTGTPFDAAYLGKQRRTPADLPKIPMSSDKVIARRGALEVRKHELSIFGFGASSDIPLVMAEQGLFDGDAIDDYWFTTEHGPHGGIVMSAWQFSANVNPDALLDGVTQFDLIDGGLCKFTALSFAQMDARGVVNVSKFGNANPGAGGFIDIAHHAQRLIFTGTFTTGGLKVDFEGGRLNIRHEGKVKKLTREAEDITYPVIEGVQERGQKALLITERAVFKICADGYELIEIAPGVDLQRDVLEQMEFVPVRIADPLPHMPTQLFLP